MPSWDGLVSPVSVTATGFGVSRELGRLPSNHSLLLQVGRLVHVEIDVDRIERDDRGQQGRAAVAALHEIADADEMAADAAVDRRRDMGEFEIELGRLQRALGLDLGGLRRLQRLAALVDDAVRRRSGLVQLSARSSSRLASSALARASASWPSAWAATASNGRGSIR